MKSGKYELVIIWERNNEKDVYEYDSEDRARECEAGMRMALGNQIAWSCVRPQYI